MPSTRRDRIAVYAVAVGFVLMSLSIAACGGKSVKRLDPSAVTDLSGRWNDTDSRQTADAMITDSLNQAWLTSHMTQSGGKKPAVIVGAIRNRSMEHIPVATFISDIERAFVNSGRVSVVAGARDRGELRAEREEQSEFASVETIKRRGMELGADFMMTGEINTIEDREGGKQVVYYQVDLTLTSIETNEKVWIGQKKIKKLIERSRFSE
ncbi:penicillin-binding protein activator LpoB [Candidatus Poribacteria bacterium]|nr:penicillin-binding protein activator LpoB [Candidatus Poribacteria bacterium]